MARKDAKNRLGKMFQYYLACNNQTLREVADEIGISAATLMRTTHGTEPDSSTLLKIWQWMFGKEMTEKTR